MHENYEGQTNDFANDIALIRLEKPVVFTETALPVCLPTSASIAASELGVQNLGNSLAGRNSIVVGWGRTNPFSAGEFLVRS